MPRKVLIGEREVVDAEFQALREEKKRKIELENLKKKKAADVEIVSLRLIQLKFLDEEEGSQGCSSRRQRASVCLCL